MHIYLITNKVNGKIYVGQTTGSWEDRWEDHKTDSKNSDMFIHRAMRKYGIDNFAVQRICECTTLAELNIAEIWAIKFMMATIPEIGYNRRLGGSPGKYSATARVNLRLVIRARMATLTPEQKAEMTAPMRRRYKELQSQGVILGGANEYTHTPVAIAKRNKTLRDNGYRPSEESNQKRAKSLKGRTFSEEGIVNIKTAALAGWAQQTPEQRITRVQKQQQSLLQHKARLRGEVYFKLRPLTSTGLIPVV